MIYLNEKFYTEVKSDKYNIHIKKIYRLTNTPKSSKTQYELNNNQKVPKNKIVILNDTMN